MVVWCVWMEGKWLPHRGPPFANSRAALLHAASDEKKKLGAPPLSPFSPTTPPPRATCSLSSMLCRWPPPHTHSSVPLHPHPQPQPPAHEKKQHHASPGFFFLPPGPGPPCLHRHRLPAGGPCVPRPPRHDGHQGRDCTWVGWVGCGSGKAFWLLAKTPVVEEDFISERGRTHTHPHTTHHIHATRRR